MSVDLPKGVHYVRARGRLYFYYAPGRGTAAAQKPVRLPDDPSSPRFWAALEQLTGDERGGVARMVDAWLASPHFDTLSAATRRDYTRYALEFRRDFGEFSPDEITAAHLLRAMDAMGEKASRANHWRAVVKAIYAWALPRGMTRTNPADAAPKRRERTQGRKPWPRWAFDLAMAEMRPDLAAAVALGYYTGQRLKDVLAMRLSDLSRRAPGDGPPDRISVRQSKTGKRLIIPVHTDLAPIVHELRRRGWMVMVARHNGAPYTPQMFQAAWSREMRKPATAAIRNAGLSFHGLRKSAAVCLAEVGCTTDEIMAVTGLSRGMVSTYTAGVDQEMMATRAMDRWESGDRGGTDRE